MSATQRYTLHRQNKLAIARAIARDEARLQKDSRLLSKIMPAALVLIALLVML